MRKILVAALGLFCLGSLARGDSFGTISSRAQQNPTDIIDWTQLGPDGTVLTTPQLVSTFGGNLALVGNLSGTSFNRVDEGSTWTGNFDYGQALVWTGNPNYGNGTGPGPFAIELGTPVASVGFDVMADLYGAFTGSVAVFDTSFNLLYTQTFSGVSNGNEDDSATFVGLADLSGPNIGLIEISTDSGVPDYANDFAIDDVSFTYAVPEPSSIFLLGSGLLGLAGLRRRFGL